MTLDQDDINAIAEAVVRKMRAAEERQMDAAFLAQLPIEEKRRRSKEVLRQAKEARKQGK